MTRDVIVAEDADSIDCKQQFLLRNDIDNSEMKVKACRYWQAFFENDFKLTLCGNILVSLKPLASEYELVCFVDDLDACH